MRDHQDGEPTVLPRSSWRFARAVDGAPVEDDGFAWLEGGFQPGKVYELTYTAIGAPVIGLGFLAYRDAASFLKHGSEAEGNPLAGAIDYAYGWGQSMNGRWLREFLYWGLNRDEQGGRCSTACCAHIGSSRRGEFNLRFGQPSTNILRAPGNIYPFAFTATPEPVTRREPRPAGPHPRQRLDAEADPRNSGMEYWWSGASLGHTTVDGAKDIEPPDDVRMYYLSGAQHGPGALPLGDTTIDGFKAQQPMNTLDYRPAMRALLTRSTAGCAKAWSHRRDAVPVVAEGTAVTRESIEAPYTSIPGAAWLAYLPQRLRMDYRPRPGRGGAHVPAEGRRRLPDPGVVGGRRLQRSRGHPVAGRRGAAGDLHRLERAPCVDGQAPG